MTVIRNRYTNEIMFEDNNKTLKELVEENKNNLWNADLRNANLWNADLREADLRNADLREANLREADLREANLREADLRKADLREANLRKAYLREADLDFSCFPLWCGSFNMKVDDKLYWQLIAHIKRLDISNCSEEVKANHNKLEGYNNFCKYRSDVDKI